MKLRTIKYNGKIVGRVYLYTDYSGNTPDEIVKNMLRKVRKTSAGYAGFDRKKDLEKQLRWQILGYKPSMHKRLDRNKVFETMKYALIKCNEVESLPIKIFVFPALGQFNEGKFNGTLGTTVRKDAIVLFVSPRIKWKIGLKSTLAHEYNHILTKHIFNEKNITLLDSLVYEGMAEHFREDVIMKGRTFWTKTHSKAECRKLFRRMSLLLSSRSTKVYYEVFFGQDDKFPPYAGYSVGYQIVRSFLKKNHNLKWKDIVNIPPKQIAKESGWL